MNIETKPTNARAPAAGVQVGSGQDAQSPRASITKIFSSAVFGVVALSGVMIVLYAWELPPFSSKIESTENAEVQGYVTSIGPQLSGYVFEVPVQDFQHVKAGDLLVRLDDRIYTQQYARAQAELDSQKAALANNTQDQLIARSTIDQDVAALRNAKAQLDKVNADWHRSKSLITDGSISRQIYDDAQAAQVQADAAYVHATAELKIAQGKLKSSVISRDAIVAAVNTATANLKLAEVDLSNTRIFAPRDGQLGQVGVRLGAWVNSGAQLMSLVPSDRWVIANMKETQMANVKLGQYATFTVDALSHQRMTGQVERIAPATGSEFALLQSDNATGNFVKIAQRLSVRIRIDELQPQFENLRPGMSVVLSIDTASQEKKVAAGHSQGSFSWADK